MKILNKIKTLSFLVLFIMFSLSFFIANYVKAEDKTDLKVFFSGVLKDETGVPVQSANYNMSFSLYDSTTTPKPLWSEDFINDSKVEIISGKFQIVLGSTNKINFDLENQDYWLGIKVGGSDDEVAWDSEMLPRIPIVTLEKLLTHNSVEITHEEFIKLLLEDFNNSALGQKDFSQKAFLEFLQEKLSGTGNQAVIISPATLSVLFDEILKFETNDNNVPKGFWNTLLDFFRNILNTISASLSQVLNQMTEVLTKLANIETKQDAIISILQDGGTADKLSRNQDDNTDSQQQMEMTSRFGVDFIVEDFGETTIPRGAKSVKVNSKYLTTNSKIFITPKSPIEGIWWISERFNEEYFQVSVLSPTNEDLLLDYWVVTPKDEMLTVFPLPETENVQNTEGVDLNVNQDEMQNNIQSEEVETSTENTSNDTQSTDDNKPKNDEVQNNTTNDTNATNTPSGTTENNNNESFIFPFKADQEKISTTTEQATTTEQLNPNTGLNTDNSNVTNATSTNTE